MSASGETAADIVSLLTNLSFMNTKDNPFAKLMVPGQGLDLATKAIDDVASDTGSQNRTYVIRRLGTLAEDVTTFEGLKQAADGIIGPPGPDLGLLLSTRDQVEQICEDFYSKVPEARQASDAIKDYVDLCGDLNASIGEYNALLAELLAAQGDQAKVTGQQKDAAAEKAKTSDPDLPLIASFAASLYRHARQDCIEQLYLASRAYSLLSLQPYDVFEAMLGHLLPSGKEPDDLDANALKGALIDIAVQRLKADQRRISDIEAFEPDADRNRVVFTDADDPLLFALLRKNHAASFRLPPARVGDGPDRTPFTNRRDVRLNAVQCHAEGLETTDGIHHIELTHTGNDHFVRGDGTEVALVHNSLEHTCEYVAATGHSTEGTDGKLDPQRQMIGPFTEWVISLPPGPNQFKTKPDGTYDLDGLTKLTVDFWGNCQNLKS